MKSVGIRNYSGPCFPLLGLNNSQYGHFLRSEHLSCMSFVNKRRDTDVKASTCRHLEEKNLTP